MQTTTAITLENWIKTLPVSQMVRPTAWTARLKYHFWRFYTPYHPVIRDSLISNGFVRHVGRQRYLLGHIAPGKSVSDLVRYLVAEGFGNHFIAWKDEGEIVGLRRVVGFSHQYHLRIFEDGEVRGHFEYTPECYPLLHLQDIGMEDHRAEFNKLLDGWIV